ncbi:hypothetical protein [Paenibacillus turpanensis]|uniref:hypothetical protein n=1 Tax=Paenibacillus turpanensis TaxID=2689078 RepID=UPI00140E3D98|nr:hypothetical protein [Paenibacillus turpanensis]
MRKLLYVLALMGMVAAGCQGPRSAEPQAEKSELQSSPAAETEVNIPFVPQDVSTEQKVTEMSASGLEQLILQKQIGPDTLYFYTKKEDTEHIYAAMKRNEKLFGLGPVAGAAYASSDLLGSGVWTQYGKSLLKITGPYGANYAETNYFELVDGKVKPFFKVDTGMAEETDLDHDGTAEIISSHGLPMQAIIYQWQGDHFGQINIGELLGAYSVSVDVRTKTIQAQQKEGSPQEVYAFRKNDLLKLAGEASKANP